MYCPHCDSDLKEYHDIPVNGGSVDGSGYVNGTFFCPDCDERVQYAGQIKLG